MDLHTMVVSNENESQTTTEVEQLRRELAQAQAEVESLGKRLALRERERDLQKQFDAYKERKRKEQEEAQSLRDLYSNLIFENNPNTLFMFDEKLRYVLGSRRFLVKPLTGDLTGVPFQEVFAGCVDADWLEKVRRQCVSVVDTQQLWRYNDKVLLDGGDSVDVQVVISPVTEEGGRKRGFLFAVNDVAELAEARQRAEEADRMKSDFLAQMSHEIRTPMNAIVGITEILLHDRDLTASQRKYVSDVKVSSNALLTIINDILDFSKLDSGKMALSPINFDLRLLVDNLCSLISLMTSEKNIGFAFETDGDLPQCLYGDDVRLRQVLLNLLSNAVKFTKEGHVVLRVSTGEDTLTFSVTDTGMGIKAEDQLGLFEPFKQANNQKNRDKQGTGLGLSICRSLVDLMGGEISLESEYGVGSTFRVVLPKVLGDVGQLTAQGVGLSEIYSSETRLLVVDDNEINLSVASGLLRTLHGLGCDTALSGEEALGLAEGTKYDLVFMDHMMPGMDGVETAARIRLLGGHNARVPIVALTANAVSGAREMLLSTAMDDFLAKPINKQELANVLRRWLSERACEPTGVEAGARGPVEYSAVLTRVMGIREIDFAAGLEGLGGNREGYEQSLRLLWRKIPGVNELMEAELFSHDDVGAFCVHVHGMMSSLASVGAGGLSRVALGLEKLAKGGDGKACRTDFPAFSGRLLALGRELGEAFGLEEGGDEGGEREVGGEEKLGEVVKELRVALGTYDYDAVMEGLEGAMGYDFGEERNRVFSVVKERVDEFDYASALDVLATLTQ